MHKIFATELNLILNKLTASTTGVISGTSEILTLLVHAFFEFHEAQYLLLCSK